MPLYETIVIVRQDISATQVESMTEQFVNVITENGGKVVETEQSGLRNLAYKIKKNKKGHYVLLKLDTPPAALAELERQMRLNEDILRFLSIRVDEHEEGPSALSKPQETRDSRGGRGGRRNDNRDRGPRRDDRSDKRDHKTEGAKSEAKEDKVEA